MHIAHIPSANGADDAIAHNKIFPLRDNSRNPTGPIHNKPNVILTARTTGEFDAFSAKVMMVTRNSKMIAGMIFRVFILMTYP